MEYVVFDLEFNQGFDKALNKTVSNEKCPFEIIQIGAIKLDSNFNIIDTFNSYVKPQIYKSIHPFVGKMTGIKPKDVIDAPTFSQVYRDFKKFISTKKNTILCVWGTGDLKELFRNITYYDLPYKNLTKSYINIQFYASMYFNNPAGKSIGLQSAIQMLNLNQDKSYHNALNDAYYTAQIFIRIYGPRVVPDVYVYNIGKTTSRKTSIKKQINYDKLFAEFSKILQRDLTKEEKKIIDLAYKMGKTNQFLIQSTIYKKR